jgi:hypothetical protein
MPEESPEDRQRRNKKIKAILLRESRRPESRSVTKGELQNLPLRASVALAARCARRVQPLFRTCHDDPRKERSHQAVDMAVEASEAVAAGVLIPDLAKRVGDLAELGRLVSRRPLPPPADQVALAAASAAAAAAAAVKADAEQVLDHAATAFSVAAGAVSFSRVVAGDDKLAAVELEKVLLGKVTDLGADEMRDALATDYENLRTQDLGQFPDLGKAVDPSDKGPLGPLWPDGAPDWYKGPST